MAIKKFKVMASNAKKKAKSDGSCIPKSMRKDVKSGCTKKSVKASDTAKKFRVDIYKKDNPDALVKREVKMFNSEDEAKKYGESIANGGIVNVIEVKASRTKKSIKSASDDSITWDPISETMNDEGEITSYSTKIGDRFFWISKNSERGWDIETSDDGDAYSLGGKYEDFKSFLAAKRYFKSHLNDILYAVGDIDDVESGCTKKSVKSSKSLTVPKSKRKSVFATSSILKEFSFNKLGKNYYEVIHKSTGKDYEVGTENGSWWVERGAPTNKSFSSKIELLQYLKQISEESKAQERAHYDSAKWGVFLDGESEPFAVFDDKSEARRTLNKQMSIKNVDGYIDEVKSSKSTKKFGVKASATAKRIAKSRITAAESDGLERAKQYIVDDYNAENPDSNDMTVDEYFKNEDLHKVGLVYTTLGDNDEYDYQISVDLIDPKVIVEIDGDVVYEDKYSNIDALADDLADFDWDNWYSYYIHKLPAEYDGIFNSCNSAKSIKCYYDSSPNYDPWEYQESYDTYYDEEPPEHIAKELERLAKLTDKYTDIWFDKFVEFHPNERFSTVYDFSDVDDAVGFTLDMAEYHPDEIKLSTDINAGITVGQDDRYDFSNPIYELDDYVKALADGVVNQIQGITYDISKETIAFFDEDNNVVFVQPIGGIIPEPDDLESDIDELSAAIKSELDNAYARVNWESEEDDSDYASRAVELSEDIGEVDIDDLEPITGDGDDEDIDYGFGFDSNGEALDESTVEELYRIAEYEILPKSELAKIDEYVSIDEDSWDFYMSSPHVTEKFYIHFKLTEKDIDFNKYALPEATAFPDFNYYTAVLDFDIYTENGEVTSVVLEEVKINRPNGAFDDYDVKRFDKLYNVDAIINYVEALAADTVMGIYNGTTNL